MAGLGVHQEGWAGSDDSRREEVRGRAEVLKYGTLLQILRA